MILVLVIVAAALLAIALAYRSSARALRYALDTERSRHIVTQAALKATNDRLDLERLNLEKASLAFETERAAHATTLADLEQLRATKPTYPDFIKLDDGIYEIQPDGMVQVGRKRRAIIEEVDPDPLAPSWP